MGQGECYGEHEVVATNLGAGMARLACRHCESVTIVLDAAGDGTEPVTAPGLFGPVRPTIFTVLAEEQREAEPPAAAQTGTVLDRGPRFAFGGASRKR